MIPRSVSPRRRRANANNARAYDFLRVRCKSAPHFQFAVMLLFHTIHRAGSAPPPFAGVDMYVGVPAISSSPTLGLLELSLTGSVRLATLIVRRGAEWIGGGNVDCTEEHRFILFMCLFHY